MAKVPAVVQAEPATKTAMMIQALPLVSVLKQKEMTEVKELMQEGVELQQLIKQYEKRQKDIKTRLQEIEDGYRIRLTPEKREKFGGGFRFGSLAYVVTEKSRDTLSKDLLLQNGVEPEIINSSMKTTTYTETRIYDMAEKISLE